MRSVTRQGVVRRASGSEGLGASRARRGDFNVLWLIVALVGVVIGVVILYFVYGGASRVLGSTSPPAVTAEEVGGVLTVNIEDTGVGNLVIYKVQLNPSGTACASSTPQYYLDGQSYAAPSSGPLATLKPGQTLTLVYSAGDCSAVTSVTVITSAGAQTAPVT